MTSASEEEATKATAKIRKIIRSAKVRGHFGHELFVDLPLIEGKKYPALFDYLESKDALESGIAEFAISMSTLEEVLMSLHEEESKAADSSTLEDIDYFFQKSRETKPGPFSTFIHLAKTTFKTRTRDSSIALYLLLLPMVCFTLATHLEKVHQSTGVRSEPLEIDLTIYQLHRLALFTRFENEPVLNMLAKLKTDEKKFEIEIVSISKWPEEPGGYKADFKAFLDSRSGLLASVFFDKEFVLVSINDTFLHSLPVLMDIIGDLYATSYHEGSKGENSVTYSNN